MKHILKNYGKYVKRLPSRIFGGFYLVPFKNSSWNAKQIKKASNSILSGKEKKIFNSFNYKRGKEWLAGRLAGKFAVLGLLDLAPSNVPLTNITIFSNANSIPICYIKDKIQKVYISISHSKGYAAAVCCNFPVGIDIERKRKINKGLIRLIFNENDDVALKTGDEKLKYIAMWCSKEAVSKSLGLGTRIKFKNIKLSKGKNGSASLKMNSRVYNFSIEIKKIGGYAIALAGLR